MKFIIFFTAFICIGCNIKRDVAKSQTSIFEHEQLEKHSKRIGDTVRFTIPKIHYKDTTIVTVNHKGTVLKTSYDNHGNISQVDCLSSAIDELIRYNRATQQDEKIKNKTENYKPDFSWMIYVALSLFLIFGIFFLLTYFIVKRKITELLSR